MLDLYWAPKPAPFSRGGFVGALLAAAAFLVVAIAALLTIDAPAREPATGVVLLVCAYLLATQVRFEIGSSFVLPTEITLVPLLFLAPLGAVPLLVAAAMALGTAVWVVRGRLPPDRLVSAVADSWHVIGPVGVLALAGAPAPTLGDWPLYAAAFGAQILIEGLVLSIREWIDRGIPLLRHAVALGEGHAVDALLFPAGLLAAAAATSSGQPTWGLLTVPFIGLLAFMDRERRQRIRISQARLTALKDARARGEAALARVGEAMSARLDAEALLDLGMRSALEAIAAEGAVVRTRDAPLTFLGDPVGALGDAIGARALAGNAPETGDSDGRAAIAAPVPGLAEPAVLVCTRVGAPFSPEERHRLATLVAQVGAALQAAETHERMRHQAETDHLTGLVNHRRFQELLAGAVDHDAHIEPSPGLLLLDLDDFKRINDCHGHQTGDLVLQAVGRLLRDRCRPGDQPARYGGEELAVVISDTTPADAVAFAERLRGDIEQLTVTSPAGARVSVTTSIGVAVMSGRPTSATVLIAAADGALYRAKQAGRNRVIVAPVSAPGSEALDTRDGYGDRDAPPPVERSGGTLADVTPS